MSLNIAESNSPGSEEDLHGRVSYRQMPIMHSVRKLERAEAVLIAASDNVPAKSARDRADPHLISCKQHNANEYDFFYCFLVRVTYESSRAISLFAWSKEISCLVTVMCFTSGKLSEAIFLIKGPLQNTSLLITPSFIIVKASFIS